MKPLVLAPLRGTLRETIKGRLIRKTGIVEKEASTAGCVGGGGGRGGGGREILATLLIVGGLPCRGKCWMGEGGYVYGLAVG